MVCISGFVKRCGSEGAPVTYAKPHGADPRLASPGVSTTFATSLLRRGALRCYKLLSERLPGTLAGACLPPCLFQLGSISGTNQRVGCAATSVHGTVSKISNVTMQILLSSMTSRWCNGQSAIQSAAPGRLQVVSFLMDHPGLGKPFSVYVVAFNIDPLRVKAR